MILAIDLGSSQIKLLAMDGEGEVKWVEAVPYETEAPRPGWLQQDPFRWEAAMKEGFSRLAGKVDLKDVEVVSFSGHMSGVVLVDRDGRALYPCVMLSDLRSGQECKTLREIFGDELEMATGNPLIQAFSLPKLLWLKHHEPQVYGKAFRWLSPKDYLRFCLTGEFGTEATDAWNSLCLDRDTRQWREDVIRESGIRRELFPQVGEPYEAAGRVTREAALWSGLREGTKVVFGGADMACGAVGNGLFETGESTLTLGTCATFLTMVEGIRRDAAGKITFHTHVLPGKMYGLGSHFNGGLAVNWLARLLSPDETVDYDEIARLSEEAGKVEPGSLGVLTIPFLAGSGSPHFDDRDRQMILGLSGAVTRAVLFRSQLEGVAYNLRETLEIFEGIVGERMERIVLGGGGVKVGIWPQIICDVFDRTFSQAQNPDASGVGAAYLGGYGAGIFSDLEAVSRKGLRIQRILGPIEENRRVYDEGYEAYRGAYGRWKG